MQMRSAIYEDVNHHCAWIQALEEKCLFQIVLCCINLLTLWLLVRQIPSFCVCGTVTGLAAEKPVSYTPLYLILQSELLQVLDLHKVLQRLPAANQTNGLDGYAGGQTVWLSLQAISGLRETQLLRSRD